jgi:cell division inhibitor SepF
MIGVLDRVKGWLFEEGEEQEVVPAPPVDSSHSQSQSQSRKKRNSLLSIHNARGEEIFVRKPKSRDDAPFCADCLRARSAVVVNLQSMNEAESQRFFDFLAGAVYSLDGQMESVGDGIFLLTPRDMDIASEDSEKATSRSEDFPFWQEAQV